MLIELEYILKLSSSNNNKSQSVKAGVLVTAKKKRINCQEWYEENE